MNKLIFSLCHTTEKFVESLRLILWRTGQLYHLLYPHQKQNLVMMKNGSSWPCKISLKTHVFCHFLFILLFMVKRRWKSDLERKRDWIGKGKGRLWGRKDRENADFNSCFAYLKVLTWLLHPRWPANKNNLSFNKTRVIYNVKTTVCHLYHHQKQRLWKFLRGTKLPGTCNLVTTFFPFSHPFQPPAPAANSTPTLKP